MQGQLSHDEECAQGATEGSRVRGDIPATAGGFAEDQVEPLISRTRVVAGEMARCMLMKDTFVGKRGLAKPFS